MIAVNVATFNHPLDHPPRVRNTVGGRGHPVYVADGPIWPQIIAKSVKFFGDIREWTANNYQSETIGGPFSR
jgi:hypothetical protein